MLQVEEKNGSLLIPPFGAGLKLLYKNKNNGKQEVARIDPGPEKNHYFAYFENDDVDFEIGMDNSSCKDKSVCFRMEVMKRKHSFVVRPNKTGRIETLESNGKKLHFIRQSGEEGKSLVSSTASSHGISRQDASTILSQIKFQVHYEVKNFGITLKDEDGKETKIDVNSQTTIDELKDKFAREIRHPVGNFSLSFNGEQFDDYDAETTLNELKINEACLLLCNKIEFPVQVKMKGEKRNFIKVFSWDLVQDLKQKIEEKKGIPIIQQKLFFNQKEIYFNMSALGWSGITRNSNSVLELEVLKNFPLQVKIVPSPNKIITIPVCSRNTIGNVMDKIEKQEGISTQQQILYLHGSQLSKNDELLEDVGIKDADTAAIFLFITKNEKQVDDGLKSAKIQKKNPHECKAEVCFPITVKNRIDGSTINLNVCSSELVRDVKEKICEETGISVEDQKLRCRRSNVDGDILKLQDDFPLDLYEIKENTELQLFVPCTDENIIILSGIPDGRNEITITMPLIPSQKIGELKSRIHEEEGIRPYILFDGQRLWGDSQTLSDYDVQKGDVLELFIDKCGGGDGCGCKKPYCRACASTRGPDFSERGAITFGGKSSQTFSSSYSFKADKSIKIEPFIIELRLAGVPLLL